MNMKEKIDDRLAVLFMEYSLKGDFCPEEETEVIALHNELTWKWFRCGFLEALIWIREKSNG